MLILKANQPHPRYYPYNWFCIRENGTNIYCEFGENRGNLDYSQMNVFIVDMKNYVFFGKRKISPFHKHSLPWYYEYPCDTNQDFHYFPSTLVPFSLLKADRPHPRYYHYTPPDYRHTDKHLGLEMTFIALCCTRQSRAPNAHCAPHIWPWHLTLTHDLESDLWSWPRPFTLKQGNSNIKTRFLAFDLRPWPIIPA